MREHSERTKFLIEDDQTFWINPRLQNISQTLPAGVQASCSAVQHTDEVKSNRRLWMCTSSSEEKLQRYATTVRTDLSVPLKGMNNVCVSCHFFFFLNGTVGKCLGCGSKRKCDPRLIRVQNKKTLKLNSKVKVPISWQKMTQEGPLTTDHLNAHWQEPTRPSSGSDYCGRVPFSPGRLSPNTWDLWYPAHMSRSSSSRTSAAFKQIKTVKRQIRVLSVWTFTRPWNKSRVSETVGTSGRSITAAGQREDGGGSLSQVQTEASPHFLKNFR